jgi:hypothetical protein
VTPIDHIFDHRIGNFTFGFEHFEHVMPEMFFKIGGFGRRADYESTIVVKTTIGGQNMQVRMEILEVAERLYGDYRSRFGILIRDSLFQVEV